MPPREGSGSFLPNELKERKWIRVGSLIDLSCLVVDSCNQVPATGGVAAMTMVIKLLPVRAGLALLELFRGEGGDDFFETRIAAERVPIGEQLQLPVAQRAG